MNLLVKLPPVIRLSILFFAAVGLASGGIKGTRSNVAVTPRYLPSFAALPTAPDRAPSSIHMRGEEEDHPESPLTEEEYEAMKEAAPVKFDGKGILTMDPHAHGMSSINRSLQSLTGPVLSTNFEGTVQDFSIPCDAMAAIGPNYIMSTGNNTYRIKTKAGALVTTVSSNVFFGYGSVFNYSDPKVMYDMLRSRFIVLEIEFVDNLEANYMVAVSLTSDPTGAWYIYQFNMMVDGATPTSNWSDFPGLGFDDNCLYMTANMFSFPLATATFQYVKTRVVDKNLMYAGMPVSFVDIVGVPPGGPSGFTIKPAQSLSPTTEEFLAINPFSGGGTFGLYHITGGPSDPVLELVSSIPVSSYSAPPDAPQRDCSTPTNSKIRTNDARTQDPVWRDGYLHEVHTIGINFGSGGVAAIRYYKIRTSDHTAVTVETFGADSTYYFYPAVTVDAAGTAYFSFGRSRADEYASAYFSGKRRNDTNIEPSSLLKPGGLAYRCGSSQRWGDYDGVALDPSDSGDTKSSAWPVGLFTKGSNIWGQWLGKTSFFYHVISGAVLEDCDSTSVTAADRLPAPLVPVYLKQGIAVVESTMTDSAGNYRFAFLDDGTYDVTITIPPGSFALDVVPGTGGDSQTRINATDVQAGVSGGSSASEHSAGNNFLIVRPHPVPAASGLTPAAYSSGEPDFTLAVHGSNFVPCSVVRIAGSDRVTTYISPSELLATILASDIDSIGQFPITVFSQSPTGGLSNPETLSVHTPAAVFSASPPGISYGNVLVGHPKVDSVTVTNTGTDTLFITSVGADNGQFTVTPPNAAIARQQSLAFAVQFIPSAIGPTSGHVIFLHNTSTSPDSVDVSGSGLDSTTYRTATAAEWATAVDLQNKHKSMKRKPDRVYFKFSLTAPANPARDARLQLSFSMTIDRLTVYASKLEADTVAYSSRTFDPKKKIWAYNFGGSVTPHQEIQIDGLGLKGKGVAVKYVWSDLAVSNSQKGSVADSLSRIDLNKPGLPLPNLNNVGEELFPKGFAQGTAFFSDATPLIVGVPRGPKGASSVRLKKYSDVIKSFIDTKTSTQHTQGPTCLNKFTSGDSMSKQQTSLSPLKKNDVLFAELMALKLNIGASASHKFPVGLGELTFNDPSDTTDPFNHLLVSAIAREADTMIACLPLASINPSPSLGELLTALHKINAAFSDSSNFKDTISFFTKTSLVGVKPLGIVDYLHATPGITPVSFVTEGSMVPGIPLAYTLYQNFPNPFNPVTNIAFDLPEPATVSLMIYDVLGRQVTTLLNHDLLDEGLQEVEFDGSAYASGVYFYRLIAQGVSDKEEGISGQHFVDVKKMLLVK